MLYSKLTASQAAQQQLNHAADVGSNANFTAVTVEQASATDITLAGKPFGYKSSNTTEIYRNTSAGMRAAKHLLTAHMGVLVPNAV